jgi:hypothetical protein
MSSNHVAAFYMTKYQPKLIFVEGIPCETYKITQYKMQDLA